jgi:hypothetical protein
MSGGLRFLIILIVAVLAAVVLAPGLERRFGKTVVLRWGVVIAIALAVAAIGVAIALVNMG